MKNVTLNEWQSLEPSEDSLLHGFMPDFDKRTRQIVEQLKDKIEILEFRSGLEVRTSSWVGRVTLGDLTITARPKITGLPLLNLLRYAYSLRDLAILAPTAAKPYY